MTNQINSHWDKLPEILQDKITLMAMERDPHPLTQVIPKSQKITKLCEKLVSKPYEQYHKNTDNPSQQDFLETGAAGKIFDTIQALITRLNAWNDLERYMKKKNWRHEAGELDDKNNEMICCFVARNIQSITRKNGWREHQDHPHAELIAYLQANFGDQIQIIAV